MPDAFSPQHLALSWIPSLVAGVRPVQSKIGHPTLAGTVNDLGQACLLQRVARLGVHHFQCLDC